MRPGDFGAVFGAERGGKGGEGELVDADEKIEDLRCRGSFEDSGVNSCSDLLRKQLAPRAYTHRSNSPQYKCALPIFPIPKRSSP